MPIAAENTLLNTSINVGFDMINSRKIFGK